MSTIGGASSQRPLTPETALVILKRTLEALDSPSNRDRLEEARTAVGNEMLKMMQHMFPVVMQVQQEVLREFEYGEEGRDGMIRFAREVRRLEREEPEIARLHGMIRAYYLPPVAINENSVVSDE